MAEPNTVATRDRRPLPVQVYGRLRDEITSGVYEPGSRLPSEAELSELFSVSRITVREALRLLQRDMLVESRHGRGHYVMTAGGLVKKPVGELQSVTELMEGLGYPMETTVLSARREAGGERAVALGIAPEDEVFRLERLRTTGGEAMIYSVDILPARSFGGGEPDWAGSLLEAMEREGIWIAYSRATIRAVVLPRAVVRRAGVPSSVPWILMDQINFTSEHRPVLLSLDYHRGDKFEFETLRQRHSE
jgi:GntR family transcriptional regulator